MHGLLHGVGKVGWVGSNKRLEGRPLQGVGSYTRSAAGLLYSEGWAVW